MNTQPHADMDPWPQGAGGDADTLDPRVVLYGEPHLPVLPGPHPQRVPALLAELLSAGSAPHREALVRDRLHVIGADWLVHAKLEQRPGARPWLRAFAVGAPGAWVERCLVAGYQAFNPECPGILPSGLPRVWDIAGLETMARSPCAGSAVRQLVAELRAGGCGSGLVFRVPAQEPAREWCVVSLMSKVPHCGWIGEQALGLAVTLGLCLHEFLSRYMPHPAESATPVLLPAQQHILRCLGHGWSNKEIARSLRLSLHAVDYHLRQLRRRFAVRNRTQLVRAAMVWQPVDGFAGVEMPAA